MRIGGLIKQSLIDWEGRLVAVVFTKGCNFRCGYCHNPLLVIPSLVDSSPDLPPAEVLAYLNSRRHWLDGVVVSGGEPTLQPDLVPFLRAVKQLGLEVKLDTNGTHPEVLTELFWEKLVNFVALDVKHYVTRADYARVTTTVTEAQITAVRQTIALLRQHPEVEYQLRTTLIPGVHPADTAEHLSAQFAPQPIRFQRFRTGTLVGDYL